MLVCQHCSKEYPKPRRGRSKYCTKKCSNAAHYQRNKEQYKERATTWYNNNVDKHKLSCQKWWAKANMSAKYSANYRAKKFKATPEWANMEEIAYVYDLAKSRGLVVDHIVPLNNPSVCGLHCEDNLRCIPNSLNSHKANYYWPDM